MFTSKYTLLQKKPEILEEKTGKIEFDEI